MMAKAMTDIDTDDKLTRPSQDGFNSSPLGQNSRHFTDNIFRCIYMNEKFHILMKISLKFVPKCPIDYNHALV